MHCCAALQGAARKRGVAQKSIEDEARRECTFKPRTNEASRRVLLRQLLAAAASDGHADE